MVKARKERVFSPEKNRIIPAFRNGGNFFLGTTACGLWAAMVSVPENYACIACDTVCIFRFFLRANGLSPLQVLYRMQVLYRKKHYNYGPLNYQDAFDKLVGFSKNNRS